MKSILCKASNIFTDNFTNTTHAPLDHTNPDTTTNDTCNLLPYDIPWNILAFWTITTLLAKIQQNRPFTYSNALDRHEISSITKFSGFSDALEVVICSNLDSDNVQLQLPSKSSIWEILFARNPENSKSPMKEILLTNSVQGPTISTIERPAGLKSDDAKELIRYTDEDWCVAIIFIMIAHAHNLYVATKAHQHFLDTFGY